MTTPNTVQTDDIASALLAAAEAATTYAFRIGQGVYFDAFYCTVDDRTPSPTGPRYLLRRPGGHVSATYVAESRLRAAD